jgi:hypothetical protein
MIKKILKKLGSVYFYIGVNIIGIPEVHIYKPILIKRIWIKGKFFKPQTNLLKNK